MIRCIFLLLGVMSHLFANTAVTENDPTTLVNGVSVITGDLFTYEEDYRVQGLEPVSLRRAYLSSMGNWNPQPHLTAVLNIPDQLFSVCEPNGTAISYETPPTKKKRLPDTQRFHSIWKKLPGVTNTASGKISAHTNYKNQYLMASKDRLSFVLHAANGTKRVYQAFHHQEKTDFGPAGKHQVVYFYALHSEELPNGNKIEYLWTHKDQLVAITTRTRRGNILARSQHPAMSRRKPPVGDVRISGSDGLSVCYKQGFLKPKQQQYGCLQAVELPDAPNQSFGRVIKKDKQHGSAHVYLESITLPQNRTIFIDYEQVYGLHYRVKRLLAPVGEDATRQVINTFHYHDDKTYADDAYGNRTIYFWNRDKRLTRIDVYEGQVQLHHSERFCWDGAQIRCKSHLDEQGKAVYARTFAYDERGNVREEVFWGNLSGNGATLKLDESGMPIDSDVERCVKRTEYTDDDRNLPQKQEESNGLVTLFEYMPGTHLLKSQVICDRGAPKIRHTYEYDDELILIREVVSDGVAHTIRQIHPRREQPYYGLPGVIEEKYCDGGQEVLLRKIGFSYGNGARIEKKSVYDAEGKHRYDVEFRYDAKGHLILETNALGWESTARYDELGNKIRSQDASGNVAIYHYDYSNRLTRKEFTGFDSIQRNTKCAYNRLHHLSMEHDHNDLPTRYVTNAFGNVVETRLPENVVLRADFDSAGREIQKTDGDGFVTKTRYNAYGKPIWIQHPDGSEEQSTYFLDGSLQSSTDATGVETHYTRDYLGRVIAKEIRQQGEILSSETFEYTGQLLTFRTDAEGYTTHICYDRAGRKISETSAGERTCYEYNALGQIQVVEKGGVRSITEYDILDRVIEERDEDSETRLVLRRVRYGYDRAGNKTDVWKWVDSQETHERFTYDSQNRLIQHIAPSGAEETVLYQDDFRNEKGQVVLRKTHTDSMGLQTIETFDPLGRLVQIEKHKDRILLSTSKEYNARGKLVRQTDRVYAPDGSFRDVTTLWEYDSRGKPINLVEADGTIDAKITQYTYTLRGEKATTTKPDGVILYYGYNGLGHNTSIHSSDHTIHHTLRYNRLGYLVQQDNILREVDAHGRTLAELFPQGYRIENEYNAHGQRVECRIPQADCAIDYAYQGRDLRQVTRKSLRGVERYTHRYLRRDLTGNLLEAELPGGLGTLNYSYDLCCRQQSIQASAYCQQVLEADLLGNIQKLTTQGDESTFTYDELYQLTSECGIFNHDYTLDALHCRLQKDSEAYQINALNQVISHIEYDKNGNPRRQGDTLYTFDALDRLIRIETPSGIERYTYDALHRRISAQSSGAIRHFLYDGQNEIGSFDENLKVQELRILGLAPHAEIGAAIGIELQERVYAPIHDLSGNIAALISLEQGNVEITHYSAYGEERGSQLSPWRFSSKRVDATGLVYYGRRYYQPELGRWLSPDPAGFTDGMNLYAFVHNNPLIHFDEFGLWMMTNQFSWSSQSSPLGASLWSASNGTNNTYNWVHNAFLCNPPQTKSVILPSLNPSSRRAPVFYINGIQNSQEDCVEGARALWASLGNDANVRPAYSESFPDIEDFQTVRASLKENYSSPFIKMLRAELTTQIKHMDAANDSRKIFCTAFSRGTADLYHAVKDFTRAQKDRLVIMGVGGIKILRRDLGFSVTNIISRGDKWSLRFHPELKENSKAYENWANVGLLDQLDGFSNTILKDHFFLSRTYQKGIQFYGRPLYYQYGGAR